MNRPAPRLQMTAHAREVMERKGFDYRAVIRAYASPDEVYPSRSHPGQVRLTGAGLCLVGVIEGDVYTVITVYADRVLTPPREDQLATEAGRDYAARYERGYR